MKKFFIMILVVGAFTGGYYLGLQPGSPDVFAWARQHYPEFAQVGEQFMGKLTGEARAVEPFVGAVPEGPATRQGDERHPEGRQ